LPCNFDNLFVDTNYLCDVDAKAVVAFTLLEFVGEDDFFKSFINL
jgi:hypothetical protein